MIDADALTRLLYEAAIAIAAAEEGPGYEEAAGSLRRLEAASEGDGAAEVSRADLRIALGYLRRVVQAHGTEAAEGDLLRAALRRRGIDPRDMIEAMENEGK